MSALWLVVLAQGFALAFMVGMYLAARRAHARAEAHLEAFRKSYDALYRSKLIEVRPDGNVPPGVVYLVGTGWS